MAVEFRLNGTQIYPIVNVTVTERIGIFSDATLPMSLTNIKQPFLPMSTLEIRDTSTNSKWNFVVVSDNVERASKTSNYWKHNVTIRSAMFQATKHVLRNNTFSQPSKKLKATCNQAAFSDVNYNDSTAFDFPYVENGKDSFSHNDINLNHRHKVSKAVLTIGTELVEYSSGLPHNNITGAFKDSHRGIQIIIKRYENGVYVEDFPVYFLETETRYDASNESIFRNIQDGTKFTVEVYNGDCYFRVHNNSNGGAFARIHATLELETYYYSMYDIVDQLYMQAIKFYNGEHSNACKWLQMNESDKVNELNDIIAPEISFNGMTYYDALYTLLSYIDAIPVINEDGYLSYEYLNDNNASEAEFDKADEKVIINDEYYTNKIVANYQNARQPQAIRYPCEERMVRVSTKNLGVPNQPDYCLRVPKPIDYIDKVTLDIGQIYINVEVVKASDGQITIFGKVPLAQIEMQDRIFEQSVYETLDDDREFYQYSYQLSNSLCYAKGNNYIDLLGESALTVLTHEIYKYAIMSQICFFFGIPSDSTIGHSWSDPLRKVITIPSIEDVIEDDITEKYKLYYNVEYHALYDGKVEQVSQINKYEGETYANQETAEVSLNRMGNNLQGLVAKVGNTQENIAVDVTSYGSRIKIGSIWQTDDYEKYIANVVQTTFSTSEDKVIVNVEFSKNFNMISQYTRIDQEKRFYEISQKLTTKGYDCITEYLYFAYKQDMLSDSNLQISSIVGEKMLAAIVQGTLTYSTYKVDYATFRPYTNTSDVTPTLSYVYIPLHIYGSGNSICFEMDFDDSLNACDRLTGDGSITPLYSKTTLYTSDKNGFSDKVELKLWCYSDNLVKTYNDDFPIINSIGDTNMATVDSYYYYKKPNEIFHLNYALALMYAEAEYPFFFGDVFVEDNNVIPTHERQTRDLKLYFGDKLQSIIDKKAVNTSTRSITSINCSYTTVGSLTYMTVEINLVSPITCESWALCDEQDNLLIASNKHLSSESQIIFYVIPRRNRI